MQQAMLWVSACHYCCHRGCGGVPVRVGGRHPDLFHTLMLPRGYGLDLACCCRLPGLTVPMLKPSEMFLSLLVLVSPSFIPSSTEDTGGCLPGYRVRECELREFILPTTSP